ncbi:retrovirus-related pol polyprotein from transposon TNT 1-94 [Tanacetum coccineum]|uniref:Retrovirus-related pol polyprotein from transposon TNT 1-94 n=1 Tax=Tanacetum coccineum TaxID=301880 RepID=A0ABQ5FWA8_9ASTR
MTESPFVDSGFAVPVFSPGDDPITCLNKAMDFLIAVASSRFPSTNNQLRTSSNLRNQVTIQDGRVTVQQVQGRQGKNYSGNTYKGNATSSRENTTSGQARVVKRYNCQGEGHIARQCTQPKRTRNAAWYKEKAMLVESQKAGQILDEEQLAFLTDPGIPASQAQTIIPHNAAFQTEDLDTCDSDCDDLSTAQAVLLANMSNYGSDVISEDFEQLPVMDFIDNEISSDSNIIPYSQYLQETQQATVQDTNLTLILEDESRSKMSEKAKDPEVSAKKISHKPIDYEKLNRLSEDFKTRFTPQQELSAEQAFWFHILNPTIEPSYSPPVIVDVPSELPKVSLVNASLKKLKFHLAQFDSVVKKRTTPSALEEGEWGFEHTKTVFNNEIIPFLKSLKDIFNVFDKDLLNEITEVQTVFDQMDAAVQQSSVDKQWKELFEKSFHKTKTIPSATTIAPGMFKLDLEPLPPRLLQNREVHIDYLRNTQEQANILREIVEQDKAKQPLDSELDFSCKYATRIQELLLYVQDTCPNVIIPSAKKVTVKPMNNVKKVRFVEPLTSSSNIKQVESSNTSDSNTPVLYSIGVKCSTSNCRSKPPRNKKNDRISQTPSRNKKNKVEAQPRKVVQIVLWYMDSGCSKHMTGNRSQLMNFVSKFLVEGLGHNLFSVGQFCDVDLEVAFWKNTCFIRNLEGVDLLSGSRDINLYIISLDDMLKSSPIYRLSKASKTKS